MRLGAYPAHLRAGSRIAEIYGKQDISERHRHRYEVNLAYRERLEARGLLFAGTSPDGCCRKRWKFPIIPGSSGCNTIPN